MTPSGSCSARQRRSACWKCSIWVWLMSRTRASSAGAVRSLSMRFSLCGLAWLAPLAPQGRVEKGPTLHGVPVLLGRHQAVAVQFRVQRHAADAELRGSTLPVVPVAAQGRGDARGLGLLLDLRERDHNLVGGLRDFAGG